MSDGNFAQEQNENQILNHNGRKWVTLDAYTKLHSIYMENFEALKLEGQDLKRKAAQLLERLEVVGGKKL